MPKKQSISFTKKKDNLVECLEKSLEKNLNNECDSDSTFEEEESVIEEEESTFEEM